ncbi:MAG: phosphoribosylamine--glycine ligase [Defluviitaleaceae bacterium]|nr:phosphoribosylamine--glycine ligase [Defluviitaleaceae bacterium]
MENVLVVGRGGREHALAWKLGQSAKVGKVFVAPGSHGMKDVAEVVDINEADHAGLVKFARDNGITLTVIGAEQPLMDGIADSFTAAGLRVWGPSAAAAQIEGSKTFSKNLMKKYGIPTATYEVFTNAAAAYEYVQTAPMPIVIKADGLAAGKGVAIVANVAEARAAIKDMMEDSKFGDSGHRVVIEEFLVGEEFSFMAFVHGEAVFPMELSRDHKRAFDNDQGPNTGGMGAYSPMPIIDQATIDESVETVLKKTAAAMVAEGRPFTGFLYGGLMATAKGPSVIEFNARFGDPEAEVLLPRLESDLFDVLQTILNGGTPQLKWSADVAVGVILASTGYPEAPETGHKITGMCNLSPGTLVFHCGTKHDGQNYYTAGGRVLIIVKKAADFATAKREVYEEVAKIECDRIFYRRDIS